MLFSKLSVVLLLALTNSVFSQVVVTETETVTVVTVTVGPPAPSTITTYVTVGGGNHHTTTKQTYTVTETTTLASVPSSDNCVVSFLGQCDGDAYNGCNNCANGLNCVFYTNWYSQCLYPGQQVHPAAAVVKTITVYR